MLCPVALHLILISFIILVILQRFSPIYNTTKMGESQQLREFKSRHYIQDLIEEGEHEHQDFKFQISDARKIARSISAFANN